MRPFVIGASGRLAAHTLLYAPAPPQSILGKHYGRQPNMCDPVMPGGGEACHGPHMYEEWFVGPAGGDAADTSAWRRPYRRTHAAPRDAFLMAPPVSFADSLVWVGSTGKVYSLPAYRIGGLYAAANGEFNTLPITLPDTPLWVNAEVRWHARLPTTYDGIRGCDEGCAAYLYAALLDGDGAEVPGFGVGDAVPVMDIDAQRIPLRWGDGNGTRTTAALAGTAVRVRIFFRDATVYAIGS